MGKTRRVRVDDPGDPRLADFRGLKGRESDALLWAEGPTVLERLVASPLRIRSVLLSAAAATRLGDLVATVSRRDVPVYVAEQAVVNEVVGFDLHRGAIAVAERPSPMAVDEVLGGARRLLVLEGVNDPENLGAIARTARALGADGMLLDPTCADPYYRRSVRVSMGEVLHLPLARTPLPGVLRRLAGEGWAVWALTPRDAAAPLAELVRGGVPERVALVVGAEGHGLSDGLLREHANVRIPIRPEVDSLNVGHAVAAALAVVASSDG